MQKKSNLIQNQISSLEQGKLNGDKRAKKKGIIKCEGGKKKTIATI